MKIRRVGAELFHADGRAEMTKPVVAFRNVARRLKVLCGFSYKRDSWIDEGDIVNSNIIKFDKC